jgi:hypothetical protein
MYGMSEIRYVMLTDESTPILLARVRWPDVAEAISSRRTDWQTDPGLFDLPYDRNSVPVTRDRAAEIAAGWGVHLGEGTANATSGRTLIRRMPANWSAMTAAERRAFSVERGPSKRRKGDHAAPRRGPGTRLRAAKCCS